MQDRKRDTGDSGSIPGQEKEVATHASLLAWKIPWTEEQRYFVL